MVVDSGTTGWAVQSQFEGKRREERFLTCAGRPFHRSERERKSRPAPFGMTAGGKRRFLTRGRILLPGCFWALSLLSAGRFCDDSCSYGRGPIFREDRAWLVGIPTTSRIGARE